MPALFESIDDGPAIPSAVVPVCRCVTDSGWLPILPTDPAQIGLALVFGAILVYAVGRYYWARLRQVQFHTDNQLGVMVAFVGAIIALYGLPTLLVKIVGSIAICILCSFQFREAQRRDTERELRIATREKEYREREAERRRKELRAIQLRGTRINHQLELLAQGVYHRSVGNDIALRAEADPVKRKVLEGERDRIEAEKQQVAMDFSLKLSPEVYFFAWAVEDDYQIDASPVLDLMPYLFGIPFDDVMKIKHALGAIVAKLNDA